jgi:ElaB/YqjD/DUF883 family membrane-anchored ribosome-binding protein
MKNRDDTGRAETPQEIIEHISRLMAEAEAMIAGPITETSGARIGELKNRLVAAKHRLNDAYSAARQSIGHAFDETRRNVLARAKLTDEAIRGNPYEAVAVALGIGVLLGAVIGRPSSD